MSKKKSKLYTITLTSEHAKALVRACDFYSRIHMGQFDEIQSLLEGIHTNWGIQRDLGLTTKLNEVRQILFPMLSDTSYLGIMCKEVGKDAHLAYEVKKTIEHCVSWTDKPLKEGDFPTVNYDKPILFPSKIKPRPKCEVLK